MKKLDSLLINCLAAKYAYTKKPEALNDLAIELLPYIRKRAKHTAWKTQNHGFYIPKEDFESNYSLALIETAETYDPRKGSFIGRLEYLISQSYGPAVWRSYSTNVGIGRNAKRYSKACLDSLDRIIHPEDGLTLGEVVLGSFISAEDEYLEKSMLQTSLSEFEKRNNLYGKIIKMIYYGVTTKELATTIGEKEYNAKTRKLVQRARQSFRHYIIDQEIINFQPI
ncbi:hypothetical protein [Paenibacillus sp. S150]|uniref:hypothetical protein n=1 Tax=Paenibacillus sp. S150 TaxID=2749826 RepID=UPI001C5944F5|nr:hypothetical protein [Paenibacillus sp. S150]MBW4080273.1 hypothetical protein [Paenibacillus sp. S150]